MRYVLTRLTVVLTVLGLSYARGADLTDYRTVYEKSRDEILSGYEAKFQGLQQQYQRSIEELKAFGVKDGDLARTKAAIAELERFGQAKSMPAEGHRESIPEIKALQGAYMKHYTKLDMELVSELGQLTGKYEQALERLQKERVKAERIDEASLVQREREKVQAALKGYAEQMATLKGSTAAAEVKSEPKAVPATPFGAKRALYLVVDLSRGPQAEKYGVTYLAEAPKGGWRDEYKRDRMVLRRLDAGSFLMGSPEEEEGRSPDESLHEVTITKPFYIGIFEVTQSQWERVMGTRPSQSGDLGSLEVCPVESVSYHDIRGRLAGGRWPERDDVDPESFMGRLRARTGLTFDLPTEAEWEYACRAGTRSAFSGIKLRPGLSSEAIMAEVGMFKETVGKANSNGSRRLGTVEVGLFQPNAWGLYDMHGNVWEWCRDWYGPYGDERRNPRGVAMGPGRVMRGGCFSSGAAHCRSAKRHHYAPEPVHNVVGFRLILAD